MTGALHVDRRDAGAATSLPLVCLHGWGMNLAVFDALRDALPDVDSWAIDLPGHGRSPWDPARADFDSQVEAVLAALPPRCVLLGWSLGGKIAMRVARRDPARLAALVLVSSTPRFAQGSDWLHGMNAGELEAFCSLVDQDWRQTLSDFVWLQLRGSRNAAAAQQRVEAALATHGAPHPQALAADLNILGGLDLRHEVATISPPALLIAGQNDRVTPPGATRWLADSLRDSQYAEIPRAGHASFISHTEEFVALLRPFLAANGAAT
jgi:pimeloyl-[acyl-carrier protein] methyl ester esterase